MLRLCEFPGSAAQRISYDMKNEPPDHESGGSLRFGYSFEGDDHSVSVPLSRSSSLELWPIIRMNSPGSVTR